MDLFQQHRLDRTEAEAPLAARLRPRSLDEFVGQDAIVGPGRLLRRAIQADQLSLSESLKYRWFEALRNVLKHFKPTASRNV